jgi:hypothetical protein
MLFQPHMRALASTLVVAGVALSDPTSHARTRKNYATRRHRPVSFILAAFVWHSSCAKRATIVQR